MSIKKIAGCDEDLTKSNEYKCDVNGKLTIYLNTFKSLKEQRYYVATTVSKHICDINKLYEYKKLGRCLLVPKYALEYFIIKKDVTKPMELANIFNVD